MNENEGSVSTEKESFDVIANKYQIVEKLALDLLERYFWPETCVQEKM
jgi:hypothetical protein